MQVNEEIDALQTMGIPPMEFLVLPRMLALMLMMPLLCVCQYDGHAGGAADWHRAPRPVPGGIRINETRKAVHLVDFGLGLGKSIVFGALVALGGCLRGMQCGPECLGRGRRATSAVVTGIVWIIATDGLFAVITERLGL